MTSLPPIAVCIPVRNERELLPLLLAALRRQGRAPDAVCLYFDGCDDGSEAVADACAEGLVLVKDAAIAAGPPSAGRARQRAMALGQRALAGRGLLLTTDADTVPADDWVAASAAALAVADIVTGRVVRAPDLPHPLQDRIEAHFDRLYDFRRGIDPLPWEPRPAHHYTAAASMGFRAEAYAALGGYEAVAAAEDARIVDAAHRAGLRVRRDRAVSVTTSSRRIGRVAGGLAGHLGALDAAGSAETVRVGHPADAAWQYRRHALARTVFAGDASPDLLAAAIDRPGATIREAMATAPNAEAFAMRIVPAAPGAERLVSLPEAERALAELERDGQVSQP